MKRLMLETYGHRSNSVLGGVTPARIFSSYPKLALPLYWNVIFISWNNNIIQPIAVFASIGTAPGRILPKRLIMTVRQLDVAGLEIIGSSVVRQLLISLCGMSLE
ncbi:unnamed protein product [Allacma fusca]|uniref:Uncharacterized protein n=1 Tax=Allacma fusca TaxID=39272 RepID=A0A8J2KLV9_9HEXA|nr:unnamed protein product [Allacma fusca]